MYIRQARRPQGVQVLRYPVVIKGPVIFMLLPRCDSANLDTATYRRNPGQGR
jgi:hypothetical protein